MAVVAGFRSVGLFEWLIKKMLCYVKNARQLELVLVLSCFFASMWITNDVALLTFCTVCSGSVAGDRLVRKSDYLSLLCRLLRRISGSMCTPIGNPTESLSVFAVGQSGYSVFKADVSGDGGVTWITAGDVALYS